MRHSKVDKIRIEIRAASLYACQEACAQNRDALCTCWGLGERLDVESETAAEDLYRTMNGGVS